MKRRALPLCYLCGLLLACPPGLPGGPWASVAPLSALQVVAEIPLAVHDGWFIVEARTPRGDRLRLVFDTGTNTDGVTGAVASEMGLERVGATRAHGGAGSEQVWLVRGPELLLGGAPAESGLHAIVDDEFVTDDIGERYDGVLGTSLLARYDVGIDAPRGALRLYRDGGAPARWATGDPGRPIAFDDLGRGLIRFTVRVDGRDIDAILDTGAPGMVANGAAARALGLDVGPQTVALAPRGVGSRTIPASRARLGTLDIGGARFEALDAVVADLALFDELGLDTTPLLIIGTPVIERCPVLVSRRSGTVRFCGTPMPAPLDPRRAARALVASMSYR